MSADRPNPLRQVAASVGTAWAAVSAVVGALVTFGVFTAAQGDAVQAAGAALPGGLVALGTVLGGLVPLLGAVVASFHTAASGKDHVTPLSSPQDAQGGALAPVQSVVPGSISGLEA